MGGLRRKAWYGLAVVGFAAGALAGAALGGGLPADLITTALPTVSTPITTVTTPTVSTPTISTPTVTTPTVSTPTVSTPTVTVRTPATTVAATVPIPVQTTATLPSVTVAATTVAAKRAVSAPVAPVTATATAAAQSLRPSVPVQPSAAVGPAPLPSVAGPVSSSRLAVPPLSSALDAASVSPSLSRAAGDVGPLTTARAPALRAATALLSPLASALATTRLTGQPAVQARPVTEAASTSPGFIRRSAPVAGVLAALTALAAVGLAGAARSTNGLAACLDLARLQFPRFRILPCPGDAAPRASELGSVAGAAPPGAGGVAASGHGHRVARRLPALHLPRLSGVLGGAVESDQPWKFLNALLLTLLVGANLVLVAVRSRIARLQSR